MATLPKIKHPLFEDIIPSTKQPIFFRPFLVLEEKILLIARESQNAAQILLGVKQVVANCIQNVDINDLALFDIEYLFLKIRSKSVSNIVEVTVTDPDDESTSTHSINLDDVTVQYPKEEISNVIPVGDEIQIVMRRPSISMIEENINAETMNEVFDSLFRSCIVSIINGDEVISPNDVSREALDDFINELDFKTYVKVKHFLENNPTLFYEIKYANKAGEEKSIILSELSDFFTSV